MTSPSDCVAIIPAKGTSRRIPRKNLAMCAGKTLVERAIECALDAGIFRKVIISSESPEVKDFAYSLHRRWPLVAVHARHPVFSADGVGVAAVVAGMLGEMREPPVSFCVLWPTSPLRTPEILRAMHAKFQTSGESSLHSASLIDFGREYWHDGTAIFMRPSYFLHRLSLDLKLGDPIYRIPDELVCDVNTPEDLAEAQRRLLAREAACPSS